MIIKGNPRSGVGFWSAHLMRTDQNERVSIVEMRGLDASTVREALRDMALIAEGSSIRKNPFYIASLNPLEHEHLSAEQWEGAVDILEHRLGLDGQSRFVVEHEKADGRVHRHVGWSRVDLETMRAIPADDNFKRHMEAARAIENAYGLTPVESVLVKGTGKPRPERRPADYEGFRAVDSRIDPQAMKAQVTALYQAADSGKSFHAALDQAGLILAKGDRRDFVLVDRAGDDHSLARRVSGVKVAEIRARLSDIDREALPSVAEAREQARNATSSGSGGQPGQPEPEPDKTPQDAPQGRETAALADPALLAAVRDEEARQLGSMANLTPDIARDLAARFGDWTEPPKGHGADDAPQAVKGAGAEEDRAPEKGETAPPPRRFAWVSRLVSGAQALWESVSQLARDEMSGAPEEQRGRLAQAADTVRGAFGMWRGAQTGNSAALQHGAELAASAGAALVRDITPRHGPPEPGHTRGRPVAGADATEPHSRPRKGRTSLEAMAAKAKPLPSTLEEMTKMHARFAPTPPEAAPEGDTTAPEPDNGPDI